MTVRAFYAPRHGNMDSNIILRQLENWKIGILPHVHSGLDSIGATV